MQAWLQSADLSSRDLDVDAEGAIRAFSSHDWAAEADLARRLDAEGQENCPAGLGLVRADGHLLHLCPGGGSVVVHWNRPTRALDFFTRRPAARTWEGVLLSSVPTLIRHFHAGNDPALEQALGR